MTRDLRLLPRGQLGIGVSKQLGRLGLQLADLRVQVELTGVRRFLELGYAGFELGNRLLEIEVCLPCALGSGGGSLTSTTVGERMAGIHQFDQPRAVDVRVDLRGRDVGMAEQRLDDAKIRSA